MSEAVYILCAITSVACAILLARGFRASRSRLLLWSTLAFVGLAINSAVLVIDRIIVPDVDLSLVRSGAAVAALLLLAIGLVEEAAA